MHLINGLDTIAVADGIVRLTFADVEKQHARYQQAFGEKPLHDQLRQLFGTTVYYERFVKSAISPPSPCRGSETRKESLRRAAR